MLFGREIPQQFRLPLAFFPPLGLGTLFALV